MDDNNIYTGGGIVPPASDNRADDAVSRPYIPKHEKPAEPQQEQTPPPQQSRPRKPVYDAFMYEPIGFDEYDRMSAAEIKADESAGKRSSALLASGLSSPSSSSWCCSRWCSVR